MIKYWLKLLTLNENSILFRTYKLLRSDANNGNTYGVGNWASHIKKILEEHGYAYCWTYQDYRLINFNSIKQRIPDCYYMTWHNDINNSEKLKPYCSYKLSFKLEPYLEIIKEPKYRNELARLRTSSHDLKKRKRKTS